MPPSVLATKSSFTPFIRAREAGRYRSIQARHSTNVEKRVRRDKLNLRRDPEPPRTNKQLRLDVYRKYMHTVALRLTPYALRHQ